MRGATSLRPTQRRAAFSLFGGIGGLPLSEQWGQVRRNGIGCPQDPEGNPKATPQHSQRTPSPATDLSATISICTEDSFLVCQLGFT